MAMTLKELRDKLNNVRTGTHGIDARVSDSFLHECISAIDAHLSAQAKVRVTRIEVDRAWDIYTGVAGVFCSRDGLRSVLEDFAARLPQVDPTNLRECTQWSQGAQGEAVAWRFLYRPTLDQEFSTEGRQWVDGSPDVAAEMHGRDPKRWMIQIAYSHPAERAAVPDEWVKGRFTYTDLFNAIGKAVEWKENKTLGISVKAFEDAMLTAAPQPPEGARVVDGEDEEPMQVARRQFADYFTKNYPGPDTVIFDPAWHAPRIFRAAVHAIEIAYGSLASTTLAGKEG